MKIVLHIGMPKTGSTSIQVNFRLHQEKLKSLGIDMPMVNDRFIHPFHLKALLFSPNPEKAAKTKPKVAEALKAIDGAAASNPDILFLSSEELAHRVQHVDILERNLHRWSDDVSVVVYMRDPVSLYRSFIQQHVKSQHYIPSPRDWSAGYLDVMEHWRAKFGDKFSAFPFERSALFKQSIVNDMVYRCDPNVAADENFDLVSANVSEVSEVSAVMQSYMFERQANKKIYGSETGNLRRWLSGVASAENVGTKCKLKEEVAETITALKRDEILELRDKHGFVFGAVDYDTLSDATVHEACLDYNKVEELCDVDHKVITSLTEAMRSRDLPDRQS